MHSFPRPTRSHIDAERRSVEGACPECGMAALAEYRVLSDGGWWDVQKCQECLTSVRRTPGPMFGSYVPLGLAVTGGTTGS